MNKKLLSFIITGFVASAAAIAQPTLTASGCNPTVGETFTLTNCPGTYSPGTSGASQTWNLSSMSGTSAGATNVITASSGPNASSFPLATVGNNNTTEGSCIYYQTSSSALKNYGIVAGTTVIPYSNPEDMLHFPFAYTNTYTDPWAGSFVSSGYTFFRSGSTAVTADGYGTLTTPNGTYTNVMRIHFVQTYQDSADVGGFPYVIDYVNDEYLWYRDGMPHSALAGVYSLVATPGGTSPGGFYISSAVGIEENSALTSMEVYPNPATEQLNVDLTLTESKNVEVRIFNSLGQQVQVINGENGAQGLNSLKVQVTELPEGIYFAQISLDGKASQTKRFVVSK
ncbi:MAG: T9SS type A sorting domain-containing protein [Bacteroidota bacterium]|nr:T9SS type A sorting domain-containing protein [Bacteroidota bacterium]